MRIPRFWAVAEGEGEGPQGQRLFRSAWGWSMSSAADALDVAHEQLRKAMTVIRTGKREGPYYPRVPLREAILDELVMDGEQAYVITRNRYGADVLNTDRVLIADIDLPELEAPSGGGLLRRLFRRPTADEAPQTEPAPVVERLGALENWARAYPEFGVIVYRTASGLRVFVTGVGEPPSSARAEQILVDLGADPIYRELCRSHDTYRARLTPKPWRLPRMRAPLGHWPYPEGRAERRFQRWLAEYEAAGQTYAVCRRLASYGSAPSTLEARIIQLHDDRTRVSTSLTLA